MIQEDGHGVPGEPSGHGGREGPVAPGGPPPAPVAPGGLPLTVLGTTDPHQVARTLGEALERTLVVVSSKIGTTIATAAAASPSFSASRR